MSPNKNFIKIAENFSELHREISLLRIFLNFIKTAQNFLFFDEITQNFSNFVKLAQIFSKFWCNCSNFL